MTALPMPPAPVALLVDRVVDPRRLRSACGVQPGNACRFVFERTGSVGWAQATDFLVSRPLKIILILIGAWLSNQVVRRAIRRFAERVAGSATSRRAARVRERGPSVLVPGEPGERSAARARTIAQVLRSIASVVIWVFAAAYVLAELGLQLGPLIAGAGVAGVALGFGAQSLVKDFLTGLIMLIEDQYGVGDVVDVGDAVGTVEEVSLRTTRIRDVNGTMWHVPNGQILRVGNKSQQWARAVVDVMVAPNTDVAKAESVLAAVATEVCGREPVRDDVLEAPEVWGVEALAPEGITIRLAVKTRPGEQWRLMRMLRVAIQDGFAEAGIRLPAPPGTLVLRPGAGTLPPSTTIGAPGQDGPVAPDPAAPAGPESAAPASPPPERHE
ncbi:MAG: mechanosensitive ion channel family protein [Actinobacteria bacterium]|nr:mechanosensitive ion channel family protein [Actinomycetota bacterium]